MRHSCWTGFNKWSNPTLLTDCLQQLLQWIRKQHRPNLCQQGHVIRCRPSHHHCRRISTCPASISQWAHGSLASERCDNRTFRIFLIADINKHVVQWSHHLHSGTANLKLHWIWRDWRRVMKCFKFAALSVDLYLPIQTAYYIHTYIYIYIYIYYIINTYKYLLSYYWQDDPAPELVPVVPHKAVAEVSRIENLYRRDWLLWVTDGRAKTLMDRTVQLCNWLTAYLSNWLSD